MAATNGTVTPKAHPGENITVADYIFTRLLQLGVHSVFGVPGDYNLRLLDFVEPAGLHWVGNCNELNAAYAADGYARINGLSALITTFGVGELSAINGIAGAYAERSPIIHIVGTPSRALQNARTLMHHTLADGEYRHFAKMASHVTAAQVNLTDSHTAPGQIDLALKQALLSSRPVYIEIPDDMVDVMVSASDLKTKITIPSAPEAKHEQPVRDQILDRMYQAQRPLILVDGESSHLGLVDQINELIKMTGWPTWTTVFGKGLVNEELPNVYGWYAGNFGNPEWKAYFDSADLILDFGPHRTDTNTQGFTTIPSQSAAISFSEGTIQIGRDLHRDISASFVSRLLENIDKNRLPKSDGPSKPTEALDVNKSDAITQKHFYRFVNTLFRPGDIILTETGTASHGGREFKLPQNARLFGAVTWLSIGYMLPATLGAGLAQRELKDAAATTSNASGTGGRTILFIGDGSLQMSVQEISTIIKEKLDIIIFIINNEGYTIERVIHGRKQGYNDIAPWRHDRLLDFFGAEKGHAAKNNFSATTYAELEEVLNNENIRGGKGLRIVEVFMGREDVEGILLYLLNKQVAEEQK